MLVLDEPVSALDVSIQAGVVNLLTGLQDGLGLAYLFIAHDLSVVRHISDRVAVMYLGKIVEIGPSTIIYDGPGTPTRRRCCRPCRCPTPAERFRRRLVLTGDVPTAALGVPVPHPLPQGRRTSAAQGVASAAHRRPACQECHPVACHFAKQRAVVGAVRLRCEVDRAQRIVARSFRPCKNHLASPDIDRPVRVSHSDRPTGGSMEHQQLGRGLADATA